MSCIAQEHLRPTIGSSANRFRKDKLQVAGDFYRFTCLDSLLLICFHHLHFSWPVFWNIVHVVPIPVDFQPRQCPFKGQYHDAPRAPRPRLVAVQDVPQPVGWGIQASHKAERPTCVLDQIGVQNRVSDVSGLPPLLWDRHISKLAF